MVLGRLKRACASSKASHIFTRKYGLRSSTMYCSSSHVLKGLDVFCPYVLVPRMTASLQCVRALTTALARFSPGATSQRKTDMFLASSAACSALPAGRASLKRREMKMSGSAVATGVAPEVVVVSLLRGSGVAAKRGMMEGSGVEVGNGGRGGR